MKPSTVLGLVALALAAFPASPRLVAAEARQPRSRLTVTIEGRGTLEPHLNGEKLEIGRRFVIAARPAPGFVFVSWTDGRGRVISDDSRLGFVMTSNAVLTAHFVRPATLATQPFADIGPADLPARVLSLVKAAPAEQQSAALTEAVKAIAAVQPAALASVCTTVGTAIPTLLKVAVSTAVTALPSAAPTVVRSALHIPTADVQEIVVAAVAAVPSKTLGIAAVALEVNPALSTVVLSDVVAAIPELKRYLEPAIEQSTGAIAPEESLRLLRDAMIHAGIPITDDGGGTKPNDYSKP